MTVNHNKSFFKFYETAIKKNIKNLNTTFNYNNIGIDNPMLLYESKFLRKKFE